MDLLSGRDCRLGRDADSRFLTADPDLTAHNARHCTMNTAFFMAFCTEFSKEFYRANAKRIPSGSKTESMGGQTLAESLKLHPDWLGRETEMLSAKRSEFVRFAYGL